jgi:cytosine/adenosine deaminase-related metal-dependent hydrolase
MILLRNCLAVRGLGADEPFVDAPEGQTSAAPGPPSSSGLDILIEGNIISRIGRGIKIPVSSTGEAEIIDCSNSVVVPGFVNTHHHFYQTLTRNHPAVQNAKLFTWLTFLYEIWKKITPDAVYWSTILATAELLKTGCTCTTDHHYLYPRGFTDDLMGLQFEGAAKTGIRFAPTRGSMSLSKKDGGLPPDSVVQDEDTILSDSERVIAAYHDPSPLSMRRVSLAPCSPFSVSPDLMRKTADLARRHGVRLHTHLAETADEDAYCERKFGKRPLALMEDCGFIGPDVSYAHGVFFTDEELALLARTRTGICHCPSSNMRLGSGITRIREMLPLGIPLSIAVDGSASQRFLRLPWRDEAGAPAPRVRYGADALTAADVYRIASEGGRGDPRIRSIAGSREGTAPTSTHFTTRGHRVRRFAVGPDRLTLFCGIGHRRPHTIVNGKTVVRNGRLTGMDEEEIIERASRVFSQAPGLRHGGLYGIHG